MEYLSAFLFFSIPALSLIAVTIWAVRFGRSRGLTGNQQIVISLPAISIAILTIAGVSGLAGNLWPIAILFWSVIALLVLILLGVLYYFNVERQEIYSEMKKAEQGSGDNATTSL